MTMQPALLYAYPHEIFNSPEIRGHFPKLETQQKVAVNPLPEKPLLLLLHFRDAFLVARMRHGFLVGDQPFRHQAR